MSEKRIWNEIPPAGDYALDVETDSLSFDRKLVLIQMYSPSGEVYLINKREVWNKIDWSKYNVCGHNLYFDFQSLSTDGGADAAPRVFFDSFIWALMTQCPEMKLEELVYKFYSRKMRKLDEVGFFQEGVEMSEEQILYAIDDAKQSWDLTHKIMASMDKTDLKIMKFELKLLVVLIGMTVDGLTFDMDGLNKYKIVVTEEVMKEEGILQEMAGWDINTDSPKQVQRYLFEETGLIPVLFTPKGSPQTSEEALNYFIGPEVDQVMKVKALKAVKKSVAPKKETGKTLFENLYDGVAHPQYQQIGWKNATSRIYSTKPSANQLPMAIREFVVPKPRNKFWYFDLSAAELYVVAKLAGCQVLIDKYESGEDLHTYVGNLLMEGLNVEVPEGFTIRDISKVMTFSIVYGSKGHAAARRMKITVKQAEEIVDYFFNLFPEINEYQDAVTVEFLATGIAKTAIGRKRKINARDAHAQRQAFNHTIQSTLADYVKNIMITLSANLTVMQGKLVISVFDSFLLEIPEEIDEVAVRKVIDRSLSDMQMKFTYKLKSGMNWREVSE